MISRMWIRTLVVAAFLATGAVRAGATELGCPGRIAVPETTATWYTAVTTNACGIPVAPGDFVIAVAEADFDGGAVCGRCARVTGPLGEVTAKITDYCPALGNVLCVPGHLDLGYDAFEQIGNPGIGVIDIGWQTVACDAASISIVFRTPSNPYYAKIQVRDARYGVASLEVREGITWRSAPLAFDGHFEFTSASPLPASFDLRLTDVHGGVVEAAGVPYTEDVVLPTSVQFPACPEPDAALSALAATFALASLQRVARTVARSSAP
jgi:expansin (peptidoglycan-binding protein)